MNNDNAFLWNFFFSSVSKISLINGWHSCRLLSRMMAKNFEVSCSRFQIFTSWHTFYIVYEVEDTYLCGTLYRSSTVKCIKQVKPPDAHSVQSDALSRKVLAWQGVARNDMWAWSYNSSIKDITTELPFHPGLFYQPWAGLPMDDRAQRERNSCPVVAALILQL